MAQRLRSVRNSTLRALDRMSLLAPAYHAYERVRSLWGSEDGEVDAEGLPVPPPRLRVEVAGTSGLDWFLDSGRQQAEIIRFAAERNGRPVNSAIFAAAFPGDDVTASANELAPPLRYEDAQFGLVYAISVFTHLPQDLERAWIDELSRIIAPAGLLLLTTHGDSYADRLDADERATYDTGEPVVRWPGVAGSNLCTTFHPEAYVRTRLAPGLELLEHTPDGGTVGSRRQDLVVFRKPAPGTAARS